MMTMVVQMPRDLQSDGENSAHNNSDAETLQRANEQDRDVYIELDGLGTIRGLPTRNRHQSEGGENLAVRVAVVDGSSLPADDGFEAHGLTVEFDGDGGTASWPIREGDGLDWPKETADVENIEVVSA